jgi:UV DNA damage endonuclease
MIKENFNLGYACLNTKLRKKNIFMSRTCRFETYNQKGFDYIKELSLQNLRDLLTILKWNNEKDIKFMRISSEIFPFASSLDYGYSIEFAKELLQEIGDYAKNNNIRITMHPGQYCVLSSKTQYIINNTISDLQHHSDILNMMGLDQNSVMIIHGGGVYGDKKKSLKRLEENIMKLPENVRNRLVLENCEMAYTIEDLLPISKKLLIPIVIDFHHDDINPSSVSVENLFDDVFSIWKIRNIKPKVHISNSCPGVTKENNKTTRRKHSDYIYYLHNSLLKIDFPIDVMIEAKMKEQSLLKLRNL